MNETSGVQQVLPADGNGRSGDYLPTSRVTDEVAEDARSRRKAFLDMMREGVAPISEEDKADYFRLVSIRSGLERDIADLEAAMADEGETEKATLQKAMDRRQEKLAETQGHLQKLEEDDPDIVIAYVRFKKLIKAAEGLVAEVEAMDSTDPKNLQDILVRGVQAGVLRKVFEPEAEVKYGGSFYAAVLQLVTSVSNFFISVANAAEEKKRMVAEEENRKIQDAAQQRIREVAEQRAKEEAMDREIHSLILTPKDLDGPVADNLAEFLGGKDEFYTFPCPDNSGTVPAKRDLQIRLVFHRETVVKGKKPEIFVVGAMGHDLGVRGFRSSNFLMELFCKDHLGIFPIYVHRNKEGINLSQVEPKRLQNQLGYQLDYEVRAVKARKLAMEMVQPGKVPGGGLTMEEVIAETEAKGI